MVESVRLVEFSTALRDCLSALLPVFTCDSFSQTVAVCIILGEIVVNIYNLEELMV